MTQKGEHTWDLIIHYHRCPNCKKIIESREDYQWQQGHYVKEIKCPFCEKIFTETHFKKRRRSLLGSEEPVEWDWSTQNTRRTS